MQIGGALRKAREAGSLFEAERRKLSSARVD